MTIAAHVGDTSGSAYAASISAPAVEVQEGDTVVVCSGFRTSSGGSSTNGISDGISNILDLVAAGSSSGYAYGAIGIKHNCAANASAVFTATLSGSLNYRSIDVFVIRPGAGETISTEAAATLTYGTGTAIASPAISTSKAAIVFGFGQTIADVTFSSEQVNGGAADAYTRTGTRFDAWYRALASSASSFTAAATASASTTWEAGVIAISASGGGSSPVPAIMQSLDQFGGGVCVR